MTTLENLWYGNISPFEQFLDGNERFQSLLSLMAKDCEKLSENFTPEQTEWLEKYDAVTNEMQTVAEIAAFQTGFRLGVKLITECLTDERMNEND